MSVMPLLQFLSDLGWPNWLLTAVSVSWTLASFGGGFVLCLAVYEEGLKRWVSVARRHKAMSRLSRQKRRARLVYSEGAGCYTKGSTAHRLVRRFLPAVFARSGARAASAKETQRQGLATLESREALSVADKASGRPGQGEAPHQPRKLLAMNPNPANAPNPAYVRAYFDAGLILFPLCNWNARRRDARTGAQVSAGKTPLLAQWRIGQPAVEKPKHIMGRMERGGNAGVRLTADWVVIDIDPRNGATPDVQAAFFKAFSLDPTKCPRVDTGRGDGGYHLYLRNPSRQRVRKGREEFPGIDVLSEGRYVVAAGSLHPDTGSEYRLSAAIAIKDAPNAPASLFKAFECVAPRNSEHQSDFGAHDIDTVAGMLAQLDPSDFRNQDNWFALMCSAHFLSAGAAEDEFVEWCRADSAYDTDGNEQSVRNRWRSLSDCADEKAINRHELLQALERAGKADAIPRPKVGAKFAQLLTEGDEAEFAKLRASLSNDNWFDAEQSDDLLNQLRQLGALTLDEFGMRYKPPKPLVEGVIGAGTVSVLSGDPGSGKSWWAVALASAVASGAADFCGVPLHAHGRVLYAALEGQGVMKHRFRAYEQHHGRKVGSNLVLVGEGISLRPEDEEGRKRLVDICRLSRPVLVILDTLSMAVAGADTDKEKDMAPALKTANAIATHTGAAVIVIHHPPKAGGSSVRGSGTIIGNVDAVYLFAKNKDEGISTLEAVKLRWGVEPPVLAYRLQAVSLHARDGEGGFEVGENGKVVTSAVLVGAEAPSLLPKPSLSSLCANALGFGKVQADAHGVLRRPLTELKEAWCERLKIKKTALHALVNDQLPLGEAGAISFEGFKLWREEKVRFGEGRGPGGTAICGRCASAPNHSDLASAIGELSGANNSGR